MLFVYKLFFNQKLCDLHGVGCRALAHLIAGVLRLRGACF
jgi:hypothetical protein